MNHNYTNEDDVKNKYQKRGRRRGERKKEKRTMLIIVSVLGVFCWTVYIVTDHRSWEERRKSLHILRRSRQLMNARNNMKAEKTTDDESYKQLSKDDLDKLFQNLDSDVTNNRHGGIRWIEDKFLKELPGQAVKNKLLIGLGLKPKQMKQGENYEFRVRRGNVPPMAWEREWEQLSESERDRGPKIDYTRQGLYDYPEKSEYVFEDYPHLETMNELFTRWPQDELEKPPSPIIEQLIHFDFSDPKDLAMAKTFRDARVPFKVYNIPEILAAGERWTDEYVSSQFDRQDSSARSHGTCQESHDNFFAFYSPATWHTNIMGPPPYRNNDWTYQKWSNHAKYADVTSLSFDQPHFYWQSGVPPSERHEPKDKWTFVSRDLPSFSANTETFFQFQPEEQKGIQCRFGERGVTAATHYDNGQNMVAMITGAKRYILSPPKECSKLGIVTSRGNTLFRHSLLNFGHILQLETFKDIPEQERGWLERSKTSLAVETVLKAGEVLFIPSHWFHYIISLQKSAQCNVRSGVDEIGTRKFGGGQDVYDCK